MIKSQTEYDKELKKFKRKFKKLKALSYIKNPKLFINSIFSHYDNAGNIGLFSKDYVEKQKEKIVNALKLNPEKAKEWLKKNSKNIFKKLRK